MYVTAVIDFHCSASSISVESYLENGRKLLAAGQLADALTQYHAAVGKLQISGRLCFTNIFIKRNDIQLNQLYLCLLSFR